MYQPFDAKKALEKLNARGITEYECPFCKHKGFNVHQDHATVLLSSELNKIELKSYIPALVFICKKCGHIDQFSLLEIDAIEKEQ